MSSDESIDSRTEDENSDEEGWHYIQPQAGGYDQELLDLNQNQIPGALGPGLGDEAFEQESFAEPDPALGYRHTSTGVRLPLHGPQRLYNIWSTSEQIGEDRRLNLHPRKGQSPYFVPDDDLGGSDDEDNPDGERPLQFTPFQWEHMNSYFIKDVEFKNRLGAGDFGEVYKVTASWRHQNKTWTRDAKGRPREVIKSKWKKRNFAVKILSHKKLQSRKLLEDTYKEMEVLRALRHPNICNLLEFIGLPDSQTNYPYAKILIFFQLCHGTYNYFRPHFPLSEDLNRHWFAQIASALYYLYSKGIVHHDIKGDNILFRIPGGKVPPITQQNLEETFLSCKFKLTDFGISEIYFPDKITAEAKKGDIENLYGLLTEHIPNLGGKRPLFKQFRQGIKKAGYPEEWRQLSKEFIDLLKKIAPGKKRAYNARQIVSHPWLQMNKVEQTMPYIVRELVERPPDPQIATEINLIESDDSDEDHSSGDESVQTTYRGREANQPGHGYGYGQPPGFPGNQGFASPFYGAKHPGQASVSNQPSYGVPTGFPGNQGFASPFYRAKHPGQASASNQPSYGVPTGFPGNQGNRGFGYPQQGVWDPTQDSGTNQPGYEAPGVYPENQGNQIFDYYIPVWDPDQPGD